MTGKPLHYSAAPAARYRKQLEVLIDRMRNEYEREITRLYRDFDAITMDASIASQARILMSALGEKWAKLFTRNSRDMAERMINQVDRDAKKRLGSSLKELSGGLSIDIPDMPGDLMDKIKAATAENVALIKSIPSEYHLRIEGTVLRSITSGQEGSKTLFDDIRHIGAVTDKRAKLIAVDQTRKVTSALNVERMKSAGVRQWKWVHSSGSAEPRPLHLKLNGEIFNYDDPPPIIDERTGERGYPGQLVGCKCVQIPVISFDD